jgi:hypothetical protein
VIHRWTAPGSGGLFGMYRLTVRSSTSKPSLRSSACILGAPQALSRAIFRMSCRISAETFGRPIPRFRDFQRQYNRNPMRYQRTTVSGFTMMRASAHRDHVDRSTVQKIRSAGRRPGRGCLSLRTASCWRRAAFSMTRSARFIIAARMRLMTILKIIPIMASRIQYMDIQVNNDVAVDVIVSPTLSVTQCFRLGRSFV